MVTAVWQEVLVLLDTILRYGFLTKECSFMRAATFEATVTVRDSFVLLRKLYYN